MSAANSNVVHYFDTVVHRIACGVRNVDHSTKHARAVNCPSCVEVLRRGAAGDAGVEDGAARAQ